MRLDDPSVGGSNSDSNSDWESSSGSTSGKRRRENPFGGVSSFVQKRARSRAPTNERMEHEQLNDSDQDQEERKRRGGGGRGEGGNGQVESTLDLVNTLGLEDRAADVGCGDVDSMMVTVRYEALPEIQRERKQDEEAMQELGVNTLDELDQHCLFCKVANMDKVNGSSADLQNIMTLSKHLVGEDVNKASRLISDAYNTHVVDKNLPRGQQEEGRDGLLRKTHWLEYKNHLHHSNSQIDVNIAEMIKILRYNLLYLGKERMWSRTYTGTEPAPELDPKVGNFNLFLRTSREYREYLKLAKCSGGGGGGGGSKKEENSGQQDTLGKPGSGSLTQNFVNIEYHGKTFSSYKSPSGGFEF